MYPKISWYEAKAFRTRIAGFKDVWVYNPDIINTRDVATQTNQVVTNGSKMLRIPCLCEYFTFEDAFTIGEVPRPASHAIRALLAPIATIAKNAVIPDEKLNASVKINLIP